MMVMMMMMRWWVLPCVHITVASSSSGQTVSHHLSLHLDRMNIMIIIMMQKIMIVVIMIIKIVFIMII